MKGGRRREGEEWGRGEGGEWERGGRRGMGERREGQKRESKEIQKSGPSWGLNPGPSEY